MDASLLSATGCAPGVATRSCDRAVTQRPSKAAFVPAALLARGPEGHRLTGWKQPHRACQERRRRCSGDASASSSSPGDSSGWGVPAGIPVDSNLADAELWACLCERPAEFATAAVRALQRLEAEAASARQQQHDTNEQGPGSMDDAAAAAAAPNSAATGAGGAASHGLCGIIYLWSLAEAYCQHPLVQESMRLALGRSGTSPLAAAGDGAKGLLQLEGEVRLLWGQQQGQYQVGAVRFANGTAQASSGPPLAGNRFGALGALAALGSHSEEPRPISRSAAARAYSMYHNWGYFNRHMWYRREAERAVMGPPTPGERRPAQRAWLPSAGPLGGASQRAETPYGEVTKVWRYFENVPEELSQIRTAEASAAADCHVRTLFGEERECITTLGRWKHMCDEAQWWGRALYDAEQLAISHAPSCATQTWR